MKDLYFISPLILQKIIWVPTRVILMYFGHLEIRGMENLSAINGNAIFACNHTSETDPLMIPASLSFFSRFSPIFYTSRENKFYKNSGWRKHFYGGYLFKAWGSYPVNVGLRDYEKSLLRHIRILNDGGNLCFFPEGKITPDGNIQTAKGGLAFLAYKTKKPIVPVKLCGAYDMSFADFVLRRRKMSITFGKPLYVREAGVEGHDQLKKAHKIERTPGINYFKKYSNVVMGMVGELHRQ